MSSLKVKTVVWLFSWRSSWHGLQIPLCLALCIPPQSYLVTLSILLPTPTPHRPSFSSNPPCSLSMSNLPRWPSFLFAVSLLFSSLECCPWKLCSLSPSQLNVTSSKNLTLTSRPREAPPCFILPRHSVLLSAPITTSLVWLSHHHTWV